VRLLIVSVISLASSFTFTSNGVAGRQLPARITLGPTPTAVLHVCAERAHMQTFPVACPTRYPQAKRSHIAATGAVLRGPSFYWASFNDAAGFPDGDQGHLILGGQRLPFSLTGTPGQTWPRPGQPRPVRQLPLPRLLTTPMQNGKTYIAQLPARVITHDALNGTPALVLTAPAYPEGGLSGGHLIILWNTRGHGYFISIHFAVSPTGASYSESERLTTAIAVAESCRLVG
jgi:hypothetical protein